MGDAASIQFTCSGCGQLLEGGLEHMGMQVECPHCGVLVQVPGGSATTAVDPHAPPPLPVEPVNHDRATFRYDVFISYRHTEPDRRWAKWLHGALETYRVPRRLVRERGLPRKLKRAFRDEDELPASADLNSEIDEALRQSRFLIVICSPRTPSSQWVNAEVQRFRDMGRNHQILALLVEGEPQDAFPSALREIRREIVEADGSTYVAIEEVEPLAADVRASRIERVWVLKRKARLRFIAKIMGCEYDDLARRERQRLLKRIWLGVVVGAMLIGMLHRLITSSTQVELYAGRWASVFGEEADRARLQAALEATRDPPPAFRTEVAEWVPQRESRQESIVREREAVLSHRPVFTADQMLELIRPPGLEDERRHVTRRPTEPGTIQRLLPLDMTLTGYLREVRVVDGKTYVVVGLPLVAMQNRGRSQTNYGDEGGVIACVIFPGERLEAGLADYAFGERVSVAVSQWPRADTVQTNEPYLRDIDWPEDMGAFEQQLHMAWRSDGVNDGHGPLLVEGLQGIGIERRDDVDSWVSAEYGRIVMPVVKRKQRFNLSRIYRHPADSIGQRGIVHGSILSVDDSHEGVYMLVDVARTKDDHVLMQLRFGAEVLPREFNDYKAKDFIEADVVLTGSAYREGRIGVASRQMSLARHRDAARRELPPAFGVFHQWNCLLADCSWVQLRERPETLVLAEGPRRKVAELTTDELQPVHVLANMTTSVGRDIRWVGTLKRIESSSGKTHIYVTIKNTVYGTMTIETMVDDPAFAAGLVDYIGEFGYVTKFCDTVELVGRVKGPGEGETIQVELQSIRRQGEPDSKVVVGEPRSQDTFRTPSLAMVLTQPDQFRERPAEISGTLMRIETRGGSCRVIVKLASYDYPMQEIEAETSDPNFARKIADYVSRDAGGYGAESTVTVSGIVRVDHYKTQNEVVLDLVWIERENEPQSRAQVGQPRAPDTLSTITEAMILSNPAGTEGLEVQKSGTLKKILLGPDMLHLEVECDDRKVVEFVTPERGFLEELKDYVTQAEHSSTADRVIVHASVHTRRKIRPTLLAKQPPFDLKLTSIQRVGDTRSSAVVGKQRVAASLVTSRMCDSYQSLLRQVPPAGEPVQFEAAFLGFDDQDKHVLVGVKGAHRRTATPIFFEGAQSAWFADYTVGDAVAVQAHTLSTPFGSPVQLEGESIVRKVNPNSMVTEQGRTKGAFNYAGWQWAWSQRRTAQPGSLFLLAGQFVQAMGRQPASIELEKLFRGNEKAKLFGYPTVFARTWMTKLTEGEELICEVVQRSATEYQVVWMSRGSDPDEKVRFARGPAHVSDSTPSPPPDPVPSLEKPAFKHAPMKDVELRLMRVEIEIRKGHTDLAKQELEAIKALIPEGHPLLGRVDALLNLTE